MMSHISNSDLIYRLGSLFSGIGGFELGFERTGRFKTVFQCEIDPFARAVLAKHWPDVERFEDVTTLDPARLPACDILIGGFPCQDLSLAGRGAGLEGAKSGLWWEFARIIRAIRPRLIVVENVPGILLPRKLECVLGELASSGYDAEWEIISACAVGAPHTRERVFIVAYPNGIRGNEQRVKSNGKTFSDGPSSSLWSQNIHQSDRFAQIPDRHAGPTAVLRTFDGFPRELDKGKRIKALGNAVSPPVAEALARQILESGILECVA